MHASEHESESKKVAEFLVYLGSELGIKMPSRVTKAASSYYGDKSMVHSMTADLCKMISELSELHLDEYVYGRTRIARRLADWWDDHQEADKVKAQAVSHEAAQDQLRLSARNKLTDDEREALGL